MSIRIAGEADIVGMHAVRTSMRENRLDDRSAIQPHDYKAFLVFYRTVGWRPAGTAANGETRFEMSRPSP